MIIWLQHLVACPAPAGPRCVTRPAKDAVITGATRATSAASPPAITASVPARAPGTPPDTGASTQPIPVSARSRAAISRVRSGWMVELSTSNLPVDASPDAVPAATPSGPNTTASTAAVSVTQRNSRSTRPASSAGESARAAPASRAGPSRSGVRPQTVVGYPASIRRRHMGVPIAPSPI